MERPDGYRGLVNDVRPRLLLPSLASWIWVCSIARLQEKQVDVVAGNSTDGLIAALGMVVLDDDRRYFPPYQAVTVTRERHLRAAPGAARRAGCARREDLRRRHAPDELCGGRPASRRHRHRPRFSRRTSALKCTRGHCPLQTLSATFVVLGARPGGSLGSQLETARHAGLPGLQDAGEVDARQSGPALRKLPLDLSHPRRLSRHDQGRSARRVRCRGPLGTLTRRAALPRDSA